MKSQGTLTVKDFLFKTTHFSGISTSTGLNSKETIMGELWFY